MNDQPQPGSHHPRYASVERDDNIVRPAMSPSRRSALRFLPLALGAFAGVLLVIIGAALLSRRSDATQPPSVTPTARQICGDLMTQQYSDLYGLLSVAQKTVGSGDQFAASQRQLDAQLGATHACASTIAGQDASSASLMLTLTRGSSAAVDVRVQLTFERGAWRIADYDSSQVAAPSRQVSHQLSLVRSMSNGG